MLFLNLVCLTVALALDSFPRDAASEPEIDARVAALALQASATVGQTMLRNNITNY
jgi:hypothetical protein